MYRYSLLLKIYRGTGAQFRDEDGTSHQGES